MVLHAAELRGKVVDPTGGPIHDTTVELRRVGNSALLRRFVTDPSGVFRFIDLPPDTYEISFNAAGSIAGKVTRTVSEDERASIGDVVLQVAAIESCPDEWDYPTTRLERLVRLVGTEVTGTAVERSGTPLRHAEVILETAGYAYRTTTDPTGTFLFRGVRSGDYKLRVVQSGFIEFAINELTVRDGYRTEIEDGLQLPRCPENVKCEPVKKILRLHLCF